MPVLYHPDLLYQNGGFVADRGLLVGNDGRILDIVSADAATQYETVRLVGKALLPGFVNGHSHSFQRLIRGRSENRGINGKDFWTWRNAMYRAALAVDHEDVYHVARMVFMEMVLSGITSVGEFHYLHQARSGQPYDDPNLLSKQIIRAAQSVGLRIALLRVAYFRAGYNLPSDPGQLRFYESKEDYLDRAAALAKEISRSHARVSFGVAPHSIRAVPLPDLEEIFSWAAEQGYPIHIHMAEQIAELDACQKEYGLTPVSLLHKHQLLTEHLTLVHAIHISAEEMDALAGAKTTICSCPTTERNLGDGIIAADHAIAKGIRFSFGSDSQAQIDPLEDARELEYHLRLIHQKRVLLDQIDGIDLSARLFSYATKGGAMSLGINAGTLQPGELADFFTIDRNDPSLCGASSTELLPMIVFALPRNAIRDVFVGGSKILADGRHPARDEIVAQYTEVHRKVWHT